MRIYIALLILLSSFVANASITINFNYHDNRKVCKLLNGTVFIVSDKQIDQSTIVTKRIFQTQNLTITCDQKRAVGSLWYTFESAHVIFSDDVTSARLTDPQAINTLYSEGMHNLPFNTYEKVGGQRRFQISCEHQKENATVATVCTASAVKN